MKDFTIVEVLEVTKTGIVPVELKGFGMLKTLYAAGAVHLGEVEPTEKSIIKRVGALKKGIFESNEGDLELAVTLEIGHSIYSKKERNFCVLAQPRKIGRVTEKELQNIFANIWEEGEQLEM